MDFQQQKDIFKDYVGQFDTSNPKIQLKLAHTFGVIHASEFIMEQLELDEEEKQLGRLIGLLHDIGRFEQLKRYNSFDDSIVSHTECGLDLLFKQHKILEFTEDSKDDNIIYEAIKNHGVFQIDQRLGERELLHTLIIRDADKLDNFRVKEVSTMEAMLDMSEEEVGKTTITDEIFKCYMNHEPIRYEHRKTPMDMWLSYLAYIFDLNYKASFQYIKEKEYIDKLIDRIPYADNVTRERMDQVRLCSKAYIENKIKE